MFYKSNITSPKIILPVVTNIESHVWHLSVVRVNDRDNFQNYLSENGVQTLIHYPIPPHKQIAFKEWNNLELPISEQIHNEIISLPISPVLKESEIKKVVDIVNAYSS